MSCSTWGKAGWLCGKSGPGLRGKSNSGLRGCKNDPEK